MSAECALSCAPSAPTCADAPACTRTPQEDAPAVREKLARFSREEQRDGTPHRASLTFRLPHEEGQGGGECQWRRVQANGNLKARCCCSQPTLSFQGWVVVGLPPPPAVGPLPRQPQQHPCQHLHRSAGRHIQLRPEDGRAPGGEEERTTHNATFIGFSLLCLPPFPAQTPCLQTTSFLFSLPFVFWSSLPFADWPPRSLRLGRSGDTSRRTAPPPSRRRQRDIAAAGR